MLKAQWMGNYSHDMNKKLGAKFALLFFVLAISSPLLSQEKEKFTFSVVPQMSAQKTQDMWNPILEKFEEKTGYHFRLKMHTSIANFETALMEGKIDFAYMNPYHLVMTQKATPYIPVVRDDSSDLVGILVVKETSDIESIKELQGKQVSFPSPNAFAASLYMRALLNAKEKIQIEPKYAKTHGNVYRNVIFSRAIAGGGVYRTFHSESEAVQEQLRIIYKTPGVAPHPLAAHPNTSVAVRQKIIDCLQSLTLNKESRKLLRAIKMPQPVQANFERDYKPLLKLNLEQYIEDTHM